MNDEIRIGTEELDCEELSRRISGLGLNVPCSVRGGLIKDGRSVATSTCHIFDDLSRWNHVLWHVGLQLRELVVPGTLSLVRVVYRGRGGWKQREGSRDARILFHVLLVQHSCVKSIHVDDALIEGSGLGKCRERIVSALENNTSLWSLTLGSLFGEYRVIREDLFQAISTMTNLRELTVLGCSAAPLVLLDVICALLADTMCLVTLAMPGIAFDEIGGTRLIDVLIHNHTIKNLSIHISILHSYKSDELSEFCRYLATSVQLTSLSVQGVRSDSDTSYTDLKHIVQALVISGVLEQLRLADFLLNCECAALLARLVSRNQGRLRILDISSCRWCIPESLQERRRACETQEDPALLKWTCPWLEAFDHTAPMVLSFLALSFAGLQPDDLLALLYVAATIESLQIISLTHVSRNHLIQVCRIIRQSGMSGRVRLEGAYLVDSTALAELREFPEAMHGMAISSVSCLSPKAFIDTVQLACTWYKLSTLKLLLTQEVFSEVPMFNKLSKCLKCAPLLSELAFIGSNQPDLDLTLKDADPPHSVLLNVISQNMSLEALRLSGIRLGKDNLSFLANQIVASKTISKIFFASWDQTENDAFLRLLVGKLCWNNSVTKLRVRASTNGVDGEQWFFIEDTITRNTGCLTRAVHFLLGDQSPRSEAAFKALCKAPALWNKYAVLTNGGLVRRTTRNIAG
ncbi:uncharacterized protein LOC142766840 [Rhipicephalus microplus]|uniref:uncharacterized protein LOC142766840 n=1 Tax=Rhipicephalus microplus TaxID=6941 RepID=UPI003F6C5B62